MRRLLSTCLIAAVLISSAAPFSASAQTTPAPTPSASKDPHGNWLAVMRLSNRSFISVVADHDKALCVVEDITETSLTCATGGLLNHKEHTFPRQEISSIRAFRAGRYAEVGALIGAGEGAVTGIIVDASYSTSSNSGQSGATTGAAYVIVVVLFAAVVSVLGASIGFITGLIHHPTIYLRA